VIRLWLHGSLTVAALLMLTVGAIVAQPRDAEIRAFFAAPEGCDAPCFLGIRPGVTTQNETLAILNAHPWVLIIKSNPDNLWWAWNNAPFTFASRLNSSYYVGRIDFRDGVVEQIYLPTAILFGDFLTLFGTPDEIITTPRYSPSTFFIVQNSVYFDEGFEIETAARCPLKTRGDMWYSNVYITWRSASRSQNEAPNAGIQGIRSC